MQLDSEIERCLRSDFDAEELEGAGVGGGWPCEDCCGACVAEADAVAGEVGEVLQEGAEAVDGLAVKGRRDYTLKPTTRGPTNGVQFSLWRAQTETS